MGELKPGLDLKHVNRAGDSVGQGGIPEAEAIVQVRMVAMYISSAIKDAIAEEVMLRLAGDDSTEEEKIDRIHGQVFNKVEDAVQIALAKNIMDFTFGVEITLR